MKQPKLSARVLLVCLIVGGLLFPPVLRGADDFSEYGNPFIWVKVGQVNVKAEVVSSPAKMYLGLGHRPGLPEGRGMLFILPSLEVQSFCMRDMRFPIDFIWLVPGRVAGLTKNVSPQDQQASYDSPEPVNYVLEVPAGFCDRYGVKVGDPVSW